MRCRTILLLVFALAGCVRVAMAINDPPYYLFPYVPESWPESVQRWFDADETETQNQLYLRSTEAYAAKQDAEIWDYKDLHRWVKLS